MVFFFFEEISFVKGFATVHGTWQCVFSFYFKFCVERSVSVYPSWKNQNSQQGLSYSFLSVCVEVESVPIPPTQCLSEHRVPASCELLSYCLARAVSVFLEGRCGKRCPGDILEYFFGSISCPGCSLGTINE